MTTAELQEVASESGIPALMEKLESHLWQLVSAHGEIGSYASATLAAGGKRLRPLLVFVAAGSEYEDEDALLRAAGAVELVHSATLVHDDILDDAALRRGHPSVFAKSGRNIAIAVGDFLFSRALRSLVRNSCPEQVRSLTTACAALVEGELMQRKDAFDLSVTAERYFERCEKKTSSLFRSACELGALNSGSDVVAFGRFGERIGLAFQLLDDVLDISGSTATMGKRPGADLLDGTITLPLILARSRDTDVAKFDLKQFAENPGGVEQLCELIAATGALTEVRAEALRIVEEAKKTLPSLPIHQKDTLIRIADGVIDRYA